MGVSTIPTVRRLQDEAYDHIKEKILSGELGEGQLYSETKITSVLGMSRTPVRDALLRLKMEGLIEIYPSRGFCVKKISKTEVAETLEIRCALEGYATYILSKKIGVAEVREVLFRLNECVDEQERLLLYEKPDILRFVESNFEFHNIMVDFLKNEEICKTYKRYENSIKDITYRRFSSSKESMRETLRSHIQIIALIRSGNAEQAFTRMINHNDAALYSNIDSEQF